VHAGVLNCNTNEARIRRFEGQWVSTRKKGGNGQMKVWSRYDQKR